MFLILLIDDIHKHIYGEVMRWKVEGSVKGREEKGKVNEGW